MNKERLEGFKALAFLMETSNRVDPNPHIGQLLPKEKEE